ncbi:protein Ycf2-like [Corylus avellana]|uniref:protein Ycf2-like n=1 Tax=Corylus avellana TaxID=13451 RepID=UPI00286B621E|nr:protein Ycf2-like [Corylus avellana]XP_059460529.1 protein Ycf2-like [Corylus avellana]
MLKQSPSKSQRTKGFKVKHAIQICLLLAICIWLLYQVKHNHEKKKRYEESFKKISEKMRNGREIIKFGRKDLHPQVEETALEIEGKEEFEEEVEDSKPEDSEDDGRGGGDDEIDGHDQERIEEEESEEVEDLTDEEDREREERSEELDSEVKGTQIEDVIFSEDQTQTEGERNTLEARKEHYKGDDASSAVVQNTQTMSTKFEIGGLRKVKEQQVDNADKMEVESDNEPNSTLEVMVNIKHSDPELSNSVKVENGAFHNAVHGEEKGSGLGFAKEAKIRPKVHRDLPLVLMDAHGSSNGTDTLSKLTQVIGSTSNGRQLFLQAVSEEQNKSLKAENQQLDVNFTLSNREMLDAYAVSEERSASESTKEENDFTTNGNLVGVVQNESFDFSEPSFYQEDEDDENGLEALAEIGNGMSNTGDNAAE